MSRYYFHIRDGRFLVPDEEGMDCRSTKAVMDEARASTRDVTKAALRRGAAAPSIEVEDEEGNEVEVVLPKTWLH